MTEVKLVLTTVNNKPAIAIVLGSCIAAEPDATLGVWHDERSSNPTYGIINMFDLKDFSNTIATMNYLVIKPLPEESITKLRNKINYYNFSNEVLQYMRLINI